MDNAALYAERSSFYGVNGIPNTQWNGIEETSGGYPNANWEPMYNVFEGIYESMVSNISSFVMELDGGMEGDEGWYEVTLSLDSDFDPEDHQIEIFVFEDRINAYWSAVSEWADARFVMRNWLSPHSISISSDGESELFSGTFDVSATWNISMVGFIAIVQNISTKQVEQADLLYVGPNYYFLYDPGVGSETVAAGNTSNISSMLTNVGQEDDEYLIELTSDLPDGWTSYLEINGENIGNNTTIALENQDSEEIIIVTETLADSEGLAENIVQIASVGYPDLVFEATFSAITYDDTLFVDASFLGDEYGWSTNPFTTIQTAIDVISSGDIVSVRTGQYPESITLVDNITISGVGADLVILSGSGGNIITGADGCIISGITVGGPHSEGSFGYFSLDAEDISIEKCVFTGTIYGIQGGGYDNLNTVIKNNDFFNFIGAAIFFSSNANPIIKNNIFQENIYAVKLYGNAECMATIDNNLFFNNDTDLYGEIDFGADNLTDTDPIFDADGIHLTQESPCIDGGYNDGIDLDPDGTIRDIGAFFFDQATVGMLGDVNHDEVINVQDVMLTVSIVLGEALPDPYEEWAADVNEDEVINVQDVMEIVNIILGGN